MFMDIFEDHTDSDVANIINEYCGEPTVIKDKLGTKSYIV
jgi:hypothetical protein